MLSSARTIGTSSTSSIGSLDTSGCRSHLTLGSSSQSGLGNPSPCPSPSPPGPLSPGHVSLRSTIGISPPPTAWEPSRAPSLRAFGAGFSMSEYFAEASDEAKEEAQASPVFSPSAGPHYRSTSRDEAVEMVELGRGGGGAVARRK
jgi:hypothetical protein